MRSSFAVSWLEVSSIYGSVDDTKITENACSGSEAMEGAIKLARQVRNRLEISGMVADNRSLSVLVRAESATTQALHFQAHILPRQYGHSAIFIWAFLRTRTLRGDPPTRECPHGITSLWQALPTSRRDRGTIRGETPTGTGGQVPRARVRHSYRVYVT